MQIILERSKINTIVVFSLKYLGDLIVQTAAFNSLRKEYPHSHISLLVRKEFVDVLKFSPYFDKIIPIDMSVKKSKGLKRFCQELQLLKTIRELKPDVAINMQAGDRFTLWAWLSGAKYRIAPRKQGFGFLNNVKVDIEEDSISYLEYYLKIVEAAGACITDKKTNYFYDTSYDEWAEKFLKQNGVINNQSVIGIHPGASMPGKAWQIDNYNELTKKLIFKDSTHVMFFVGPNEKELIGNSALKFSSNIIIADTSDDIGKLSALMKRCAVCITNDSGARHISIASGVRTLTLIPEDYLKCWNFYSEEDGQFILVGKRVNNDKTPESSFLDGISVESVYEKIKEILKI